MLTSSLKKFDEKFIGEADLIYDEINMPYVLFEGKMWSLDMFLDEKVKQFWIEEIKEILEAIQKPDGEEGQTKPCKDVLEMNYLIGLNKGWNQRNQEINSAISALLSTEE